MGGVQGVLDEIGARLMCWTDCVETWQPTVLVLSPHHFLNQLPLHAATWKDKPLIEHLPVTYLPSPSVGNQLLRRRRGASDHALLVGNPTKDLKGSEQEVKCVAKDVARAGMRPNTLIRERAITTSVIRYAPSSTLLHFACHSTIDFVDFLRSGIELADRRMTVLDILATVALEKAQLVYLSSCDSGQPVLGRTDGLSALLSVFAYAGCPTVIGSLWPVDDRVGRFFACHFYRFWLRGSKPVAVAFQEAKRRTRKKYPQPLYWAPFVLMGAWETLPVVTGRASEPVNDCETLGEINDIEKGSSP